MGKEVKLATTDPDLKDRIKIDIDDDSGEGIYWYIKFNIPLNENTVSNKAMTITDAKGYKMRTEIMYYKSRNTIVISPKESYMENVFYILTISKKVKSLGGNHLKGDTHILFKLKDNQISQYEILKDDIKIPAPCERPINYEELMMKAYPRAVIKNMYIKRLVNPFSGNRDVIDPRDVMGAVYKSRFTEEAEENGEQEEDERAEEELYNAFTGGAEEEGNNSQKLRGEHIEYIDINIDIIFCLAAFSVFIISIFIDMTWLVILSAVICVLSVLYLINQLIRQKAVFVIVYNRGVDNYNKGNYQKALKYFEQALKRDKENEALYKLIYRTAKKAEKEE